MLPPLPLPLPPSSRTSQPANSGVSLEAQPIGADEVEGVEPSNVDVPGNADAGETELLQHVPRGAALPVRKRSRNPRVGLGSHVR